MGFRGPKNPQRQKAKAGVNRWKCIVWRKAFISLSEGPVNQKLRAIWKTPSTPSPLELYVFKQKPTPHPSGPPRLQLQETLSFLRSLWQKAWDLVPCKVSPGSRASPRLRRQKKPGHPMISLVWLAPAHSSRPMEGGGCQCCGPQVHRDLTSTSPCVSPGTSLNHLLRKTWFSLNWGKESLTGSQVKKKQSSARRPRKGEGDQPVPCPPRMTNGRGRRRQGGWAPKGPATAAVGAGGGEWGQ